MFAWSHFFPSFFSPSSPAIKTKICFILGGGRNHWGFCVFRFFSPLTHLFCLFPLQKLEEKKSQNPHKNLKGIWGRAWETNKTKSFFISCFDLFRWKISKQMKALFLWKGFMKMEFYCSASPTHRLPANVQTGLTGDHWCLGCSRTVHVHAFLSDPSPKLPFLCPALQSLGGYKGCPRVLEHAVLHMCKWSSFLNPLWPCYLPIKILCINPH